MHFHKAGGILLQDKKILVTRSKGSAIFLAPGGKIETGETATEALCRELAEELSIDVEASNLSYFDSFQHPAAGHKDATTMQVFLINDWSGTIKPGNEIEEIRWIDSRTLKDQEVGSIFAQEVIPKLQTKGLIA